MYLAKKFSVMTENLCLQWNNFNENVNSAFGRLREDGDLTDVTLACEDGQHLEAHKVILAASSPFFGEVLLKIRHPHPLIYLRGFKSHDLAAILDFLYCGEANVLKENLDSFLAIAEELKLKGLAIRSFSDFLNEQEISSNSKLFHNSNNSVEQHSTQQKTFDNSVQPELFNNPIQHDLKLKGISTQSVLKGEKTGILQTGILQTGLRTQSVLKGEETASNPKPNPNNRNESFSMNPTKYSVTNDSEKDVDESENVSDIPNHFDLQVLDKKVKSMMEKSQNKFLSESNGRSMSGKLTICKVCGKEGMTTTIRNHIEANHLEGISIPCDRCDKEFTSRVGLTMHKGRHHR